MQRVDATLMDRLRGALIVALDDEHDAGHPVAVVPITTMPLGQAG
jgi:hypothetical protein